MFVNVVRCPDDGNSQRHTSLYECERIHIHPVEGTRTEFTITIEGRAQTREAVAVTYDTNEKGLGIYVMNDRGQTIDTIFRSL